MMTGTLQIPADLRPETRASERAFSRVEVFETAERIAAAWAELEACPFGSVYQTRAFCLPWTETLGRKAGYRPLFVLARDETDCPVALLALGIVRRGPLRVAMWLGGKDSNFNLPLLRNPAAWTGRELRRLLRLAAKCCRSDKPHLFELLNQPFHWAGMHNPMTGLPHGPSPSAAFATALDGSAEAVFAAKFSKDARKKLRKKAGKLETFGPVSYEVVSTLEQQQAVLSAFLAQKTERFRQKGISSEFETPEMRAFIEHASQPSGRGIELHALRVGARIVAIYGGGAHNGQWSGMFNSFDADEEIARCSPGDLLLLRIVERCCQAGLTRFDLGIGEARYKAALCDEEVRLFDSFVPVSTIGLAYAAAGLARQRFKGVVKRNARLLALARRVRGRVG